MDPGSGQMRRHLTIALSYLVVYVAASVLGLALTWIAIGGFNALPRDLRLGALSGAWIGIVLNVLPASVVGVVVFYVMAAVWTRPGVAPSRHVVRAAPLYGAAALFCSILVIGFSNASQSGFGLIAQLYVSPALVALGGMAGDLLGQRHGRHLRDGAARPRAAAA